MLGPVGHVGGLFAYLATARRQHASDRTWVDLFLCGISGRRFTPRYIERDDFFRPLDAPSRFSFNVNLTGFAEEVHRVSRDVPLATLEVGARIA